MFRFDLADTLTLAEHAITAPQRAEPVDDEPIGPALLLVIDDGVYLMSNGLPQLPPGPDQPPYTTVRVVYADNPGHDDPGPDGDDLVIALPLCQPGQGQLIDELRAAASIDLNTLAVAICGDEVAARVIRVPPAPGTPHVG
ncbi:hypothetical protein [Plantactinospora endophytica]|uniref:hypothetical protein n=1 Tax=Plantactinospora endophytica TaxID=673535 RepID=UPI00194449F3|nr:hypothetical protein [Plantactinospora endophytica]